MSRHPHYGLDVYREDREQEWRLERVRAVVGWVLWRALIGSVVVMVFLALAARF